ncbi:hypothetical protein GN109_01660 [Collimonas pratensis]|uniref:hypothetical protein n=1 Tax=Collimonas pratensis TaxID=279113 RepID=UPI00143CCFF9|nr:hypothetical protein [Collimonas pratensis]NKI68112.1 hypothetical protein [Collimonas pratensis]
MAIHSRQARQDVAHIHLEHAYIMLAGDKESVRAARWNGIPPRDRQMLAHMAGIGSKKGDTTLQSLNALERGKLHWEASRLIKQLQNVLRCAQGGELPCQFPAASHESDGITA